MDASQMGIVVDTDVLVSIMLNELNREGYIDNTAYLAAKEKLKEDGFYVNEEHVQQGRD